MHSDSKFRSTSTFSHRSASEQFDSDASGHTATGTSIHSRTGSTESDMISSSRESSTLPRPQPSRSSTTDAHSRPAESLSRRTPSWDERRAFDGDAPMPPRHKFSDSHSSLSSYGSWQSRSHSRISSVTTVSGGYTGGSSLAELPILESNLPEREEPKTRPAHREERPSLSLTTKLQPPVIAGVERPKSPSDAVLNMKGLARPQPNVESLRTPLSRASHLFSSPKLHKRAISAPDFASASGSLPSRMHPYTVLPPPHQVMGISATSSPPGARSASSAVAAAARERLEGRELGDVREVESEQRGRKLSTARTSATPGGLVPSPDPGFHAVAAAAAQQGEEAMGSKSEEAEPHCMFVANCDTGSQLRKAISHLFGRNKSCTLKIPKEVWVYYCRKHYQRIRYRNARTYPSNQMELVKVQIRRLQSWSEGNQAKGEGPYIKQWTLSLRKREQNRLESGKGSVEEGGDDDHLGGQGGSVVPEWIIQLVGDGYPTDKMLEIAERLHKDITDGVLSQVPEIEFLPDIVDDDEGGSARCTTRACRR
ncbi:hypothetical protein CDD83_3277 [Cordyceps sp. RAO-2017]|nr:hypothetical protein CDD83_3277 [Cordyceps sp. RAO-2017]